MSNVISGIYIVCIFICFFAMLVHTRIKDGASIAYDGEFMGMLFVCSMAWPIVLITSIWLALWEKVIRKICISLVEKLVSKFNH